MTSTTLTPSRARVHAEYRNMTLWTLQGWLAMFFIAAGYGKLTEPMDNLIALMNWPAMASEGFVRGLGLVELALAVGVLAPLVSWRFGRSILLFSAGGLLALETVMLGVHLMGADWSLAVVNLLLLAITAPVLAGRRHAA